MATNDDRSRIPTTRESMSLLSISEGDAEQELHLILGGGRRAEYGKRACVGGPAGVADLRGDMNQQSFDIHAGAYREARGRQMPATPYKAALIAGRAERRSGIEERLGEG